MLGIKSSHDLYDLEHWGFIPDEQGRATAYNLFARGYDKEGYEEAYNQYYGKIHENQKASWWNGSPTELYRRLAGETEARNVQTRLDYTDDQRRNTTLADTEDTPRDKQIIRHENTGASEMGSIDGFSSFRRGKLEEIAKKISSDRGANPEEKLRVKLNGLTKEERMAVQIAVSKESNGTLEELRKRADAIQNSKPIKIDKTAIDISTLKSNLAGKVIIVGDDGMHVTFTNKAVEKLFNVIVSETGVAKNIEKLLSEAHYAFSQEQNNVGCPVIMERLILNVRMRWNIAVTSPNSIMEKAYFIVGLLLCVMLMATIYRMGQRFQTSK